MLASARRTPEEADLDIAASSPPTPRTGLVDRLRAGTSTGDVAALASFAVAGVVYVRTLLPGVSFGDWAEAQMLPSRLGILHPTGYPLYLLLGKAFSLLPVGSVAYRANLLSAMAAAAAVGVAVLIMVRLGIRPVLAACAALTLAFTGTLWQEATFSEMNGLHLLLVTLLLHRALVWRAQRRDRDLLIGALLAGLCVSNHGLAITVVPVVVLFVVVDARREIAGHPWIVVRAIGAFVLGLLPYLYLPLRASFGPAEAYAPFLTWDGFFGHVSGAQFRSSMHFLSGDSVATAWAATPQVVDHLVTTSNPVFVLAGIVGVAVVAVRDHWFGLLIVALGLLNVYIYANYLGDLSHYLLLTWLILAIGVGMAAESVVAFLVARTDARAAAAGVVAVLALALALAGSNWASHDQSANRDGERFTDEVFASLPPNAMLVTYWDALAPLAYEHCVEGVRSDVRLRAYDGFPLLDCDPPERPLDAVAEGRPVYALMVFPDALREQTGLEPVPEGTIRLPWGKRYADVDRPLYRMVSDDAAP